MTLDKSVTDTEESLTIDEFSVVLPDSIRESSLPAAVAYCRSRQAILQSAGEAIAIQSALDTAYPLAKRHQLTRTTAIYFIDETDAVSLAIDDYADPKGNVILNSGGMGYALYKGKRAWVVPAKEALVDNVLDRAYKDDRVVLIGKGGVRSLSTLQRGGVSKFGRDDLVLKILGSRSEVAAALFSSNGVASAKISIATPDYVREYLGRNGRNEVMIVPVSLSEPQRGIVDAGCTMPRHHFEGYFHGVKY